MLLFGLATIVVGKIAPDTSNVGSESLEDEAE
jgi:hypothetical protein